MTPRRSSVSRVGLGVVHAVSCMLAFVLLVGPAHAHGVDHRVERATAVTVTFTYGDGTPIAFAEYRVVGPHDPLPTVAGRTDRAGRVVFLPDRPGAWTVQVTTDDGHGKTVRLDLAGDDLVTRASAGQTARWLRTALGVGVILLIALVLSAVLRRGRDRGRAAERA
jgi:hypothetical protein